MNTASANLVCPRGHGGQYRYVEAVEMWRQVLDVKPGHLVVSSQSQTGEGYNDGIEGTAYLECRAGMEGGGYCVERVELPDTIAIDWD